MSDGFSYHQCRGTLRPGGCSFWVNYAGSEPFCALTLGVAVLIPFANKVATNGDLIASAKMEALI